MIEYRENTGDKGVLIVQDKTDTADKLVEVYIQSVSPVYIHELPWAYSIDGVRSSWKSFRFMATTVEQKVGVIFVGQAREFVLHLGDTNTTQLGGPTDFEVTLQVDVKTVSIKVGNVYKKAIPYVCISPGVWKKASPFVHTEDGWKETV